MTKFYIAVILTLFLGIVLIGGCISKTNTLDRTNNITVDRSDENENHLNTSQNYSITIDPIQNSIVGESVRISGTTNAPQGTLLTIIFYGPNCFASTEKNSVRFCRNYGPFYTTTESDIAHYPINIFSINVSSLDKVPDVYDIDIQIRDTRGDVIAANVSQLVLNLPTKSSF